MSAMGFSVNGEHISLIRLRSAEKQGSQSRSRGMKWMGLLCRSSENFRISPNTSASLDRNTKVARTPQLAHPSTFSSAINPLYSIFSQPDIGSKYRFNDDSLFGIVNVAFAYLILGKLRKANEGKNRHANLRIIVLVIARHNCGRNVTWSDPAAYTSTGILGTRRGSPRDDRILRTNVQAVAYFQAARKSQSARHRRRGDRPFL